MKTAYELAMERLTKKSPAVKLTADQKRRLAEIDSQYAARIAGREITMRDEIARAADAGDAEKVGQLQHQWADERRSLQTELEEKKEKVRQARS